MDNPTPTTTETPTTDPAPTGGTPAPAAAAAPAPKMLTQEQVDEIVQRRLAEDRARRERQVQPAPAPAPAAKSTPTTPADEMAALKLKLEEFEQRSAFDKRVGRFGLSDARYDSLFTLFKAQRPENPSEWVENTVKEFGWNMPTQPTTPAPAATPASPDPQKPPAAAPSAPAPHALPTNQGFPDIFNMTREQFAQFVGAGQLRPTLEKMWAQGATQQGAPRRPTPPQK